MNKPYYMRIFISMIIFMGSMTIPLNISFTLTEAQQQQSEMIISTKNVTDLIQMTKNQMLN